MRHFTPLLLLAAVACGAEPLLDPTTSAASFDRENAAARVRVMTQNLYVGGNVDLVIAALATPDEADDLAALQTVIGQFQATDFPTRAGALADLLARYRPHAVALQEISTVTIQLPPFGLDIHLPFLPVLQATLAARGLPYQVAAANPNFDVTVIPGISLADQDVLLYDPTQVTLLSSTNADYAAHLPSAYYGGLDVRYGWASFVGEVGGRPYRFVGTHPDAGHLQPMVDVREAQAEELVALFGDAPEPVILMGDLNDPEGSPLHDVLTAGGFVDAWRAMHPGAAGRTCCHEPDLSEPVPAFDQRIDYVFVKGLGSGGRLQGQVAIVGDQPGDRVAGPYYPIWLADHAGLVATFLAPAGRTAGD